MNRNQYIILAVAVALIIVFYFVYQNYSDGDRKTCFNLPTSSDTDVFGPAYWHAFHKLASDVPCSHCRGFAEKFIMFFHDIVNVKTGKPIYNQDNYNYFLTSISNLNSGQAFNDAFGIPAPTAQS